jgi:hypothetical protein
VAFGMQVPCPAFFGTGGFVRPGPHPGLARITRTHTGRVHCVSSSTASASLVRDSGSAIQALRYGFVVRDDADHPLHIDVHVRAELPAQRSWIMTVKAGMITEPDSEGMEARAV